MAEPTKGPWATTDGMIVFAGGWTLNPVADCEFTHPYGLLTIAERNANARLIAAAPDTLAALENILASALEWADSVQYDRDASWEYNDEPVIVAARAAIAKAKGHATSPLTTLPLRYRLAEPERKE